MKRFVVLAHLNYELFDHTGEMTEESAADWVRREVSAFLPEDATLVLVETVEVSDA